MQHGINHQTLLTPLLLLYFLSPPATYADNYLLLLIKLTYTLMQMYLHWQQKLPCVSSSRLKVNSLHIYNQPSTLYLKPNINMHYDNKVITSQS